MVHWEWEGKAEDCVINHFLLWLIEEVIRQDKKKKSLGEEGGKSKPNTVGPLCDLLHGQNSKS